MSSLKLGNIFRCTSFKNQLKLSSVRWYGEKGKNHDETESKTKEKDVKNKSEQVINKLNNLLKEMSMVTEKSKTPIELAKPTPKFKKLDKEIKPTRKVNDSEKLVKSVKDVAETLGGNTKITEAELMKKLLSTEETETASNLTDIFKGMKIDRSQSQSTEQHSRSEQVKQILAMAQRQQKSRQPTEKRMRKNSISRKTNDQLKLDNVDLFGAEPLGIFTNPTELLENVSATKTWEKLYQHEMKLAVTHPPANYFQQMILWTEQGKIWKFPIDNEQGMDEEQNVCFTEHVFLEKHLESWCPPRGPIRHFMELVCVGLSKNPYLTADAKREHIEWYKEYFSSKKDLLKEVGAGDLSTSVAPPKSIEQQ